MEREQGGPEPRLSRLVQPNARSQQGKPLNSNHENQYMLRYNLKSIEGDMSSQQRLKSMRIIVFISNPQIFRLSLP